MIIATATATTTAPPPSPPSTTAESGETGKKRKKDGRGKRVKPEAVDGVSAGDGHEHGDGVDEVKTHSGYRNEVGSNEAGGIEVDSGPSVFQDQGFTRPRLLVLCPFRGSAYAYVTALIRVLGENSTVGGLEKFNDEFGAHEEQVVLLNTVLNTVLHTVLNTVLNTVLHTVLHTVLNTVLNTVLTQYLLTQDQLSTKHSTSSVLTNSGPAQYLIT